ncbi:hypothetical protein J3P84_13580 [Pseudomonas sp. Z1-29]|uniref:hypothetical protein n=1 Tax=Pseudomonas sp. Z1-29 TaxID=2817410 RepID=UPI003DA80D9A
MLFEDFVSQVSAIWRHYFTGVSKHKSEGNLVSDGRPLFPNMILFTKCKGFYICELFGASESYKGLVIKRNEQPSVYRYLDQFDGKSSSPLFAIGSGGVSYSLGTSRALDSIQVRFPYIHTYRTHLFGGGAGDNGCVFEFRDDFERCFIGNCVLINTKGPLHRCKNILSMFICNSRSSKSAVDTYLRQYLVEDAQGHVRGVHTVDGDAGARLAVVSQFQNLYLQTGLRETTIGEFVSLHPEIIKQAFDTDCFLYEPSMVWLEHDGTCFDQAINPDLLIRRKDGYFDIYDLKAALLDKKRLTKGERRLLSGINRTLSGGVTGVGGMDVGIAPVSGAVAVYLIYNPNSALSATNPALLGVNATSIVAPEICGGSMPAGYTASALVSVWRTTSDTAFDTGYQVDRNIWTNTVQILSTTTMQASLTSLPLAAAVPRNAKTFRGMAAITSTTNPANLSFAISGASVPIGQISMAITNGAVNGGLSASCGDVPLVAPQTAFYSCATSAGTATLIIGINGYSF